MIEKIKTRQKIKKKAEDKKMSSIPLVPFIDSGGNARISDLYSKFVEEERTIFLYQDVDRQAASAITAILFYLQSLDSEKPISIYLNTNGGEVYAGLSIISAMELVRARGCLIYTFCLGGICASMGAVILACGDHRVATPYATIMIHDVFLSHTSGTSRDVEIDAKETIRLRDLLISILSKRTGKHPDDLKRDSERDFYMSAQQAKDYGLIDSVLSAAAAA